MAQPLPFTPCPRCGREAPLVYRGVVPYCTACGSLRPPLSAPSFNMAGKPARVGGAFASVVGWIVLVFGGSFSLGAFLLLMALGWPGGAFAIGLPILLVTLVVGIALIKSGRSLASSGSQVERETRTQALLSMAAHRGAVTARDAAELLGLSVGEADAMLTDLAKREPDRVALDVDEQGTVWYRVASAPGEPIPQLRIDVTEGVPNEERVDDQGRRAARAPR
jgi:hypothetical protein